ncbi:tRNA (adenosine(37)-N6)-dimethylallyltransferase MiaA [Chitinophaga oryziterrae]|uniref:tRNA dimethylallyltransferase n=1 Tax=Chitinophaga oryziterrae TaxID=1031224 RepID=A0A6N8JB34_9BACT|nr:tRNA (adenosine(37)-N6)-dimethylallyltransferase MiaA [Chitinophaga oryziterrae]MVT41526.1 tRNA (adenosine(37)-N6)-dimethylallyltransferase MiaA [Chitinophaga oryziterrae]
MGKTVIIIAGPTAAGKTALAIRLASHFKTAVISADSRQCYKEISIGTAKPSLQELQTVPHYFIDSHSITEEVNAGIFERLSLQYAAEIFKDRDVAIMCGGTGLYIRAFCEGIDDIPAAPADIRLKINEQYATEGLEWLQKEVQERDPAFYAIAEIQNPQRLIRALEVLYTTGQSITTFRTANKATRDFNIIRIGVTVPKEQLHANITHRVHAMMAAGLVEEVRAVLPYRHHNALQTVGYKEIFDYLDGKITLEEATELIIIHTRQYAKRQLTWFRKDPAIQWFDARDTEGVMKYINTRLH